MLLDNIGNLSPEPVSGGHLNAFFNVVGDDKRAHRGLERVVLINIPVILDEIPRLRCLADIVIISGDARKQRVCVNRYCGALHERAYRYGMVIRAGGLLCEFLQKRVIQPRKLKEFDARRIFKEAFYDRTEPYGEY